MKDIIGVFDSGLGGLSVVKHLERLVPGQDIVYFGDTGRVPYGSRSPETIEKYARQDIKFLLSQNASCIIAACGTVSSVAPDVGKGLKIPYIEVVTPAAKAAMGATSNGKIGVIGTSATVVSKAYTKTLLSQSPELEVFEISCPLLVPIVEEGWISPDDEITSGVVRRYLQPFLSFGIDTLILGCTHYPLLKDTISKVVGKNITLIDTGYEAAKAAAELVGDRPGEKGARLYYVSDKVDGFLRISQMFLGHSIDEIKRVDIERI